MKKRSAKSSPLVKASKLTRARAEKISAVEGLKLSPKMAKAFERFDQQGLSNDQRREAVKAEFRKKYA